MKSPIIAALLLTLTTPALAASDKAMMRELEDTYGTCIYRTPEKYPGGEAAHAKVCDRSSVLNQKLEARGYCVYGRGHTGRPSRDRKHCYTIKY